MRQTAKAIKISVTFIFITTVSLTSSKLNSDFVLTVHDAGSHTNLYQNINTDRMLLGSFMIVLY